MHTQKTDFDLNISNLIASAPEALNTLNDLAQALANDPNHATTAFNQLATKATTAYADGQLVRKANQATTYTKVEVDTLLTPTATQTDVDIALASKADLSAMLIALSQKHPTITSTIDLTVNNIITKSLEPPVGTTIVQLRTNSVMFGIRMYASITSTKTSFWTPVYISQGLEVNTGVTVGYNNPFFARLTIDAANRHVVTFGTI